MLLYGVCLSDVKIDWNKVIVFLKEYDKEQYDELFQCLGENATDKEIMNRLCECCIDGTIHILSIGELLRDVIASETGVELTIAVPRRCYLGVSANVPWNFNDATRALTADSFGDMLLKYVSKITSDTLDTPSWHYDPNE